MPALPADIFAGSREVAIASWESATIAARYPTARDGSAAPATGYFDKMADAQAMIDARAALIGVERRRFKAVAIDMIWPDAAGLVQQVRLIDGEQGADGAFLTARFELDLEAETTTYELFG